MKATFDKAIGQPEKEGPCPEELEPYPKSFLSPPVMISQRLEPSSPSDLWLPVIYVLESSSSSGDDGAVHTKRFLDDGEDGRPRKRRRTGPSSTSSDRGNPRYSEGSTVIMSDHSG